MSLDFCLETNMLELSYKHLELSYYCYFHVFSIVKTTLCIYILDMNGVRSHWHGKKEQKYIFSYTL